MERIEGASIYLPDENGGWKAIASLWDVPGAKFYPETDQFSGTRCTNGNRASKWRGVPAIP